MKTYSLKLAIKNRYFANLFKTFNQFFKEANEQLLKAEAVAIRTANGVLQKGLVIFIDEPQEKKQKPKAKKVMMDKKKPLKKKVKKVMKEFKEGKLHSGSKKGPEVTNPKQAIAIALSEGRKAKGKK